MLPKKQFYKAQAESIIKNLAIRGMDGVYCETSEDALKTAMGLLTPGCSVSWGGSETLKEVGLMDALKSSDYTLYDRALAKTPDEQDELYADTVNSDFYFMSSNAVTVNGELINIDGSGNRVACLIYGPKHVIVMAGMNKIVTDVPSGVSRVRNFASPPNTIRLNKNTPCAKNGLCGNCLSEDCICCQIVITRKSRQPGRIKVILIGEELGY